MHLLKSAFPFSSFVIQQMDNEAIPQTTRLRVVSAATVGSGILRPRCLPQEIAQASGRRSPEVRDPGRSSAFDGSWKPDQRDLRASSSETSARKPSTATRNNNAANKFLPTNLSSGISGQHHQLLLQQGIARGSDNSFTPRGLPSWPAAASTSAAMAAAVAAASGMGLSPFLPWNLPGMPLNDPSGSSRDAGAYPSPLHLLMTRMATQQYHGHVSPGFLTQSHGASGQLFFDSPFNNLMPGSGMTGSGMPRRGSGRGRPEMAGDALGRGMLEQQVGSSRANSPDDLELVREACSAIAVDSCVDGLSALSAHYRTAEAAGPTAPMTCWEKCALQ